ncbi:MAG: DUF2934 domain-containing protein [Candidatus Sulfotelmatobacter sp.]
MADKSKELAKQGLVELATDFLGEDRHEFVAKLAYQLWEKRGRPFGPPEVDWFAAERAVYLSLLAAGLIAPCADDPQNLVRKIYW